MFFHHYIYRLKCILRDKETMFWTLAFPIILATLFNLAFSNIGNVESFKEIRIGVVENEEFGRDLYFRRVLESVSNDGDSGGVSHDGVSLFNVAYVGKDEADRLLKKNQISGYIIFDKGIKLVVRRNGINQTIIKSFLDDYIQTSSTVTTIFRANPSAPAYRVAESAGIRNDHLEEVPAGKAKPKPILTYFYSLIGMACLYGGFFGLKEITALQANLSAQGARVNVAPTHKLSILTASLLAASTVQFFCILVLLGYLALLIKIDFGEQLGLIALTCLVGTVTGISFGACITAAVKGGEGIKIGILILASMVMSFLSGMMYDGMKYIISTKVPVLSRINPVNLINDSLYALYYFDTYRRFFMNISLLSLFAAAFILVTYFILRRQRYASI